MDVWVRAACGESGPRPGEEGAGIGEPLME